MAYVGEKFWDKTAAKYAQDPVRDEQTYQRKLSETQAVLKADMNLLEFGCGTGTTAVHHAPHVATIKALDISENMLEIGRGRAQEAGVSNVEFVHSTVFDYAAGSEELDGVLALNVLHLMADWREAVVESARILKPGGIFVTSTVCLANSKLRFIKWVEPLARAVGLMPNLYILSEAELVDAIEGAGLQIETRWQHAKDGIAVFIVARKN